MYVDPSPASSRLNIWHLTTDAPRRPARVAPGDAVELIIGTSPVGPDQCVDVECEVRDRGAGRWEHARARWVENRGGRSYWRATVGPFDRGDRIRYRAIIQDADATTASTPYHDVTIGPRAHVAIVWHQHQPMYQRQAAADARGSIVLPWVRLHTLRDYVSMPMLALEYPGLQVTFNLTPCLLDQVEAYVAGATDRALELTLIPAEVLGDQERREVLATFFDASELHQIRPHRRYRELHALREAGHRWNPGELRDLQMWANLAWFAAEFRQRDVPLPTGEVVSIAHLVRKERDFDQSDLCAMVEEQRKLLRAVVPAHRLLVERSGGELTTSPYFHPVLPLLIDSADATIDLDGATAPPPFSAADDAEAQIATAIAAHARRFGAPPRGFWPSEAAVSPAVIPLLARHGIEWTATDEGVLARSGRWGYEVERPDVLYRGYRVGAPDASLAVLFRDQALSDDIGFTLQHEADPERAAERWLEHLRARANELAPEGDAIITVVVDGENPWGGYADDGRPFLRALYRRLVSADDVATITPGAWVGGMPDDGVAAHPASGLPLVSPLFAGSWIDEAGSRYGVDHGTWIGEPDENEAWALVAAARRWLLDRPRVPPAALRALHAAEGSDWFWWLGRDHASDVATTFEAIFRDHLASVYRLAGGEPPAGLARPLPFGDAVAPGVTDR